MRVTALFMSTIERTHKYVAQHIALKRCINAICLLHVDQSNIVHAVGSAAFSALEVNSRYDQTIHQIRTEHRPRAGDSSCCHVRAVEQCPLAASLSDAMKSLPIKILDIN